MGNYYELVLKAELEENTPDEVIQILTHLFKDRTATLPSLPDHPFFTENNWLSIGKSNSCSAYHHPEVFNSLVLDKFDNGARLFTRFNLKNDSAIIDFLSWILPYIQLWKNDSIYIGWLWYHDHYSPQLIYLHDGYISIDDDLIFNTSEGLINHLTQTTNDFLTINVISTIECPVCFTEPHHPCYINSLQGQFDLQNHIHKERYKSEITKEITNV